MQLKLSLDIFNLILSIDTSILRTVGLRDNETGYVYLVSSGMDDEVEYKIGQTSHIKRRMRDLGNQNDCFKIVCTAAVPDHQKMERVLHKIFSEERLHGEWFCLNDDDIDIFIDTVSICGRIIDLQDREKIESQPRIEPIPDNFGAPVPNKTVHDIMLLLQEGVTYSEANLCGTDKPLPGGQRGREIKGYLLDWLLDEGLVAWNATNDDGEGLRNQGVWLTMKGANW